MFTGTWNLKAMANCGETAPHGPQHIEAPNKHASPTVPDPLQSDPCPAGSGCRRRQEHIASRGLHCLLRSGLALPP